MAKLIYAAIASLDGYVEDEEGGFDWAAPDDEVHAFVNDLERPIGTYLYGRRMYETMVFWETVNPEADEPRVILDYAEIWRAAEKIVYSRTLETVTSSEDAARERVRARRGPAAQAVHDGRHLSRGCRARRPGNRRGAGRRVPSVRARCWWEAASAPCQTTIACNSNFSMSAGSETASSTSTTASASDPAGNTTSGNECVTVMRERSWQS